MLRKLTIGKKVFLGFSVVLALLAVISVVSLRALGEASDGFTRYRGLARETNLAGRIQADMLELRMQVKDYIITGDTKYRDTYETTLGEINALLSEGEQAIAQPDRAALIREIKGDVTDYEGGFEVVVREMQQRDRLLTEALNVKGPLAEQTLSAIMESAHRDGDVDAALHAGQALRNLLLARLYVLKYLDTNDAASVDRVSQEFKTMQQRLTTLDEELQNPQRREMLANVQAIKNEYAAVFNDLVAAITRRNDVIAGTLDRIGPKVAADTEDLKLSIMGEQDELGPRVQASNRTASTVALIASFVAIATGLGLAILITRGINRTLTRVISGLASSSEQTTAAATQVAASSQSLAEGASEQAASVEETNARVEEMSAVTRQTAANAGEADTLASTAQDAAERGTGAVARMGQAIDDIKRSSDETAKIVKTIDEIAFQTNLLALNAAVEAARAGEAGKGFAVVAEEVRNLAQRSAEAAKNTSQLIEESVTNSDNGVVISKEVAKIFDEIGLGNRKVNNLIGEIAAACNEQADGIDQVNLAVQQMEQVTQKNAANAEESASAAEELNAQAEELDHAVGELAQMIGRSRRQDVDHFRPNAPAGPGPRRRRNVPSHVTGTAAANRTPAESTLPLDEQKEMAGF